MHNIVFNNFEHAGDHITSGDCEQFFMDSFSGTGDNWRMHYQTFKVKMPDFRGGMPGFLSKQSPQMVDGVCHVISKQEINIGNPMLPILAGGNGQVINRESHREFTESEFNELPQKYREDLQKNGLIATSIPSFSAHIKPFQS